jgi:hypothetical protein
MYTFYSRPRWGGYNRRGGGGGGWGGRAWGRRNNNNNNDGFARGGRWRFGGGRNNNNNRWGRGRGRGRYNNRYLLLQCGGSGMFIPDLGSRISGIPDPKTAMKDISEKNLLSYLFFGVINFTKLNYFFEMLKKKIWANFQRIIELFTQKIVSKLLAWDP